MFSNYLIMNSSNEQRHEKLINLLTFSGKPGGKQGNVFLHLLLPPAFLCVLYVDLLCVALCSASCIILLAKYLFRNYRVLIIKSKHEHRENMPLINM